MPGLDKLDKAIIIELEGNCRQSYKELATKFNLTANAIKKRVGKLVEEGAIIDFRIELSLAMLDADFFWIDISTDGSENEVDFGDRIGKHRLVEAVNRLADGTYTAWGEYSGATELAAIGRYIRRTKGVTHVKMHPAIGMCPTLSPLSKVNSKGRKIAFNTTQLQALQCLSKDPRMQIKDLAKCMKSTARRARTVLTELQNSEAIYFTLRWDRSAFGDIELEIRLHFNESKAEPLAVLDWLKERYAFQYWTSYLFADEPVFHITMVVSDLREGQQLRRALKQAPFTTNVDVFVSYPFRRFPGLGLHRITELIDESGV
ncbi:MAG: Lrp/AsnC family transcriptional regulator [Candidatus Odinarchaeota archaeon]